MSKTTQSAGNEGIQASSVTAEVLAVGHKAQTTKNVLSGSDQERLKAAAERIDRLLSALPGDDDTSREMRSSADELKTRVAEPKAHKDRIAELLHGITGYAKTFGTVIGDVSTLKESISTIAKVLSIPLF
ncbi:hypothetical protein [Candidatus Burkholderia verschuerenii]|uniref:hypothetical protein n=1 Tax=Candidatus Burkholderia verschuerenii TaxID=242163 RepID=UPI00067AF660|nr:hypothetical protein [Candidatus Burkholderia verschuerenii]